MGIFSAKITDQMGMDFGSPAAHPDQPNPITPSTGLLPV